MNRIDRILKAMRADCVPKGRSGLWSVIKGIVDEEATKKAHFNSLYAGSGKFLESGRYTYLTRWTEGTIYSSDYGELVMNDFLCELKKHLDFVLKARGRVLVTGLGLGCVVRGLIENGRCDSIDLVERDENVIKLCAKSVENRIVKIHHIDAREFKPDGYYDFAWHDLWSDPDKDEPHLQLIHSEIIHKLDGMVGRFGAWAMPRKISRMIPDWI